MSTDEHRKNDLNERDLSTRERLLLIEQALQNFSQKQSDLDKEFRTAFASLESKFDLYVRLERYKIVELAVFGVIGLMTTAVIVALLAVVIKGAP